MISGAGMAVGAACLAIVAARGGFGDPNAIDLSARFAPISGTHPLGADHIGRDLLARMTTGAARTLIAVIVALAISLSIGVAMGVAAALATGAREVFLLRLTQATAATPRLVIALALTAVTGMEPISAGLAVALTSWARYALVAHGLAGEVMAREHWRAALALGVHPLRASYRHILPILSAPMRAFAGADGGRIVVIFASLAFLGLGADTGASDWGAMAWEYRLFLFEAPRLALTPLAAIVGLSLALHLACEPPKLSA